jgi:1-acyl-sn-glycerol-3-phosphate acyltransferase
MMGGTIWPLYRVLMGIEYLHLRIQNRLEIHGQQHIPKSGCIFLINHIGSKDVDIFMTAFRKPVGVFTDVGFSWFSDFIEEILNWVPRRGKPDEMIEKMIRTILFKNRYFAMWPEGSPSQSGKVMEAFSGVVKVYAVLNALEDRIPFVPVILRGADCYWGWQEKRSGTKKIFVDYFKPIFIPRAWLKPPDQGGKTPRDIINRVMLLMAHKLGQKELAKNWALSYRRADTNRTWHDEAHIEAKKAYNKRIKKQSKQSKIKK